MRSIPSMQFRVFLVLTLMMSFSLVSSVGADQSDWSNNVDVFGISKFCASNSCNAYVDNLIVCDVEARGNLTIETICSGVSGQKGKSRNDRSGVADNTEAAGLNHGISYVFNANTMQVAGITIPSSVFEFRYANGVIDNVIPLIPFGPALNAWPLMPVNLVEILSPVDVAFAVPLDFVASGTVQIDLHLLVDYTPLLDLLLPPVHSGNIELQLQFDFKGNGEKLGINVSPVFGFAETIKTGNFFVEEPTFDGTTELGIDIPAANQSLILYVIRVTLPDSSLVAAKDWAHVAITRIDDTFEEGNYPGTAYLSEVTVNYIY